MYPSGHDPSMSGLAQFLVFNRRCPIESVLYGILPNAFCKLRNKASPINFNAGIKAI